MAQPANPIWDVFAECTNKHVGMPTAITYDLEEGSYGLLKALFMHSPGEAEKNYSFLVVLEVCSLEMLCSIFFV